MEHGFYAEAKNYILYRWQRTERRKALNHIVNETGDETITDTLKGIGQDFPRNEYSLTLLAEKFSSFYKPEMTPNERLTALIKAAVSFRRRSRQYGSPASDAITTRCSSQFLITFCSTGL